MIHSSAKTIRPPAVASLFYPGNPAVLRKQIKEFLDSSPDSEKMTAKAIIAPHAGYKYSGSVAAIAYRSLLSAKSRIKRVVLLGFRAPGPACRISRPLYGILCNPFGSHPN